MWAPALVALAVTATVIGLVERRELAMNTTLAARGRAVPSGFTLGLGLAAVVVATVLVVVLHSPALPVAIVGTLAVAVRLATGRQHPRRVAEVLSLPLLIGLFGIAVGLGTVGRSWSGPATLLSHAGAGGTAVAGALASVAVNNLPAASLLAARHPGHPFALLIGLNIGPNLYVTGSLAWLLWLKAARQAGARPSIGRATRLGVISVPLALGAALGVLIASGSR